MFNTLSGADKLWGVAVRMGRERERRKKEGMDKGASKGDEKEIEGIHALERASGYSGS